MDVAASNKSTTTTAFRLSAGKKRFKGVRMRSWGKWVSEIRLPNTRGRLWLGSYSTAEQAARAFDVAVVCLRGSSAVLNFPDSPPSYAPFGLSPHHIQELAASAAAAAAASPANASPSSPFPISAASGGQLDLSLASSSETSGSCGEPEAATSETNTRCSQCSSLVPSTLDDDETAAFEQLLLLDEVQPSSTLHSSISLAALHDELLMNMGCESWEQLLWGRSTFDSWIMACVPPPLIMNDEDLVLISLASRAFDLP